MPQSLRLALALTVTLTSCASMGSFFAEPELSPAELAVLTAAAGCDVTPIVKGVRVSGALDAQDCKRPGGRPIDFYGVKSEGNPRTEYGTLMTTFTVSSAEFDPVARILAKGNERNTRTDNDSGRGLNARIRVALAENIYLIEVTSSSPGPAEGAYSLSITTGPAQ